jgi:hypothetical protein
MVSKYTRVSLSGTISSAGAIDVYSDKIIRGKIEAVYVDYPAGTVAVTVQTDELVSQKIVELGAANTDKVYYPRVAVQSNAGADLNNSYDNTAVTKLYDNYVVFSRLRLVCASGTAGQVVKVAVVYEEY